MTDLKEGKQVTVKSLGKTGVLYLKTFKYEGWLIYLDEYHTYENGGSSRLYVAPTDDIELFVKKKRGEK